MSEKELSMLADAGMNAKGVVDDEELKAVDGGCSYKGEGSCSGGENWRYFGACDTEAWKASCDEAWRNGGRSWCH